MEASEDEIIKVDDGKEDCFPDNSEDEQDQPRVDDNKPETTLPSPGLGLDEYEDALNAFGSYKPLPLDKNTYVD